MPRLSLVDRVKARTRVLQAALQLIGDCIIPSEKQLHDRLPDLGTTTLIALRDELRELGLLDWSHLSRQGPCPGPGHVSRRGENSGGGTGATRQELIEAFVMQMVIRREKAARGEPPPRSRDKPPPPEARKREYACPEFDAASWRLSE